MTSESVVEHFRMPTRIRITDRISSVTNAFVNSIIPIRNPSTEDILEALQVLGMTEAVRCVYCSDPYTEWDHLRPLVVNRQPTGFISEIQNLVPACGKCNQSKGNKDWATWMTSSARLSPSTRGIEQIDAKMEKLHAYTAWRTPTKIDFRTNISSELWDRHWKNCDEIVARMQQAEVTAKEINGLLT